jgi:hypothetical protein
MAEAVKLNLRFWMHVGILLASLSGLGGCSWNLSDAAPFRDTVGTELPLQQDVALRRDEIRGPDGVWGMTIHLKPSGPDSTPKQEYLRLPAGTVIRIESVTGSSFIGTTLSVIGVVVEKPDIKWGYQWGFGGGSEIYLERAPWEFQENVPKMRLLGGNGRYFVQDTRSQSEN